MWGLKKKKRQTQLLLKIHLFRRQGIIFAAANILAVNVSVLSWTMRFQAGADTQAVKLVPLWLGLSRGTISSAPQPFHLLVRVVINMVLHGRRATPGFLGRAPHGSRRCHILAVIALSSATGMVMGCLVACCMQTYTYYHPFTPLLCFWQSVGISVY